jgi:hypothetical protein
MRRPRALIGERGLLLCLRQIADDILCEISGKRLELFPPFGRKPIESCHSGLADPRSAIRAFLGVRADLEAQFLGVFSGEHFPELFIAGFCHDFMDVFSSIHKNAFLLVYL